PQCRDPRCLHPSPTRRSSDLDDDLAAQRFPRELLAITQLAGPQYLSSTLDIMPARTARDYQDIVARLDAVPQRMAQVEARLRRGDRKSTRLNSSHLGNSYAGF